MIKKEKKPYKKIKEPNLDIKNDKDKIIPTGTKKKKERKINKQQKGLSH